MYWSFEFDEAGRFVRTSISDRFAPERLIGFFAGLFNQPYWRPGTPLLIDINKLDIGLCGARDVQVLKSIMTALKMRLGFGKLALSCADESRFEFGSQLSLIVGPAIDREVCVFQIEEAAINWLTTLRREQWPVAGLPKRETTFKDETITTAPVS